MKTNKKLSPKDQETLLKLLSSRFVQNIQRHKGLKWDAIEAKLEANPTTLWSLSEMERTDGEPDVIGYDKKKDEYIFCDCAEQSPKGRRSICFDKKALDARKEHKPKNSAMSMAEDMGIEMLTEEQYRTLQTLGEFDTTTSSWIQTPPEIRTLGGAIFCDRRYDTVFTYHNGADSYYAARGFRGMLRV